MQAADARRQAADAQRQAADAERRAADAQRQAAAEAELRRAAEDANILLGIERALLALVSRTRNVDGENALSPDESSSASPSPPASFASDFSSPITAAFSPTFAAPAWEWCDAVFDELAVSVEEFDAALSRRLAAAVSTCSAAPSGCPERPSTKRPDADSVHGHVRPVVANIVEALKAAHPEALRSVHVLYEAPYNGRGGVSIPDQSIALTPSLSAESQLFVIEDKVFAVLVNPEACPGELQVAGYVALSLLSRLAEGISLRELATHPLVARGLYTDSHVATLVEVCVTSAGVSVRACRMPFLPNNAVDAATLRLYAGERMAEAHGAVALALCVLSALLDSRNRAACTTADILAVLPAAPALMSAALSLPLMAAPLLGSGSFARVFAIGSWALKVPRSFRMTGVQWEKMIRAEARALQLLAARAPPCAHFPQLMGPPPPLDADESHGGISTVTLRMSADGEEPSTAAGAAARGYSTPALLLSPVCTTLVNAALELRARMPLEGRSVDALVFFALAIAMPLLAAQAHARTLGVTQGDARIDNIGLEAWDGAVALAILRSCRWWRRFSSATYAAHPGAEGPRRSIPSKRARLVDVADSDSDEKAEELATGAAAYLPPIVAAAMCRRVLLNDWGAVRSFRSNNAADRASVEARDTREALDVVRGVLGLLLNYLSPRELREALEASAAEDSPVPQWWEGTLMRCGKVSAVLKSNALPPGTSPLLCVLGVLGIADLDPSLLHRSSVASRRKRGAGALPAGAQTTWGLCVAAAAATACGCWPLAALQAANVG